MSSESYKLTRARSKLRKKRKATAESKLSLQARMFKELNKSGYNLDKILLTSKYATLISRMANGRADPGSISSLFKTYKQDAIIGETAQSVFKTTSLEKYVVVLVGASFKDRAFNGSVSFMASNVGDYVHVTSMNGRSFSVKPTSLVFGALISCTKLPADIRKWDKAWAKSVMRSRYKTDIYADRTSKGSMESLLCNGTKSMHQLMTINMSPSKKQLVTKKKSKIKNLEQVPEEIYGGPGPLLYEY